MATLYKRGKVYWIKWYEGGKPRYESTGSKDKKVAQAAKATKELQLSSGAITMARANCTFEEFTVEYLNWYSGEYPWAEKARRHMIDRSLMSTFGRQRLGSIKPQTVEAWKHERASGVGAHTQRPIKRSTINTELQVLKAVINKAVEWGVIPSNSVNYVKPFQILEANPRRFFTVDELEAIYAADPDRAAYWKLLANTGLRIGEARALRWENVFPNVVRVVSTSANKTKNRRWRDVPISPGCRSALDELKKEGGVFVLPVTGKNTLRQWFQSAASGVGIEGTLHELRHTFISHLVMQGVPLRTVQALAGHGSITVTEQYSHLAPEHMADAVTNLRL